MDNTGAMPLRLELDGVALGASDGHTSASPSPAALSASLVTTASPYSIAPSSASSMQIFSSDTPLRREYKRPRMISRHSSAISGTPTDMRDRPGHQIMDRPHERLDVNYSQDLEMGSQSSSTMAVVTPSTMPNETYPVVGAPYWSSHSLAAGSMDRSTPENGDTNNRLGGGEGQMHGGAQSQIYGNSAAWGHDMSAPMNSMQQYVPRRMADGSWESELRHSQMQPDGSLELPYETSSAASNNPQMYGDYPMVSGPTHRIVPSNAYGTPNGNSTPTTPRLAPSTAAGWTQSTFHGPGDSTGTANMRSSSRFSGTGLGKEIKPKVLASSASSLPRRSPVQQNAATALKSERAKSGDRTTHNDVERKYRTNLKDRIAELRAAGTVLSKATEYIQQLEQANRAMANEHQQLMERLHTLEAMLQSSGARTAQYTPNHGMNMFDPRGFS
ncbi:hypothetical protein LLEC1_03973 [Akanthomyces lecanii]|uniref:Uncharacterized protein n=1 Tax=Cordyceps confragosa TaxID=2714763 RepID=A0A179IAZ4_CORDF|nr:hypothetical protein LLEC1_03973 [Akanthomyces lecanii]